MVQLCVFGFSFTSSTAPALRGMVVLTKLFKSWQHEVVAELPTIQRHLGNSTVPTLKFPSLPTRIFTRTVIAPGGNHTITNSQTNSFLATPKREETSHFTEAWQLPPPRARQESATGGGTAGDGMGGADHSLRGGGGAYVGLFRPPGGKKSDMGFHMCVAVIPLRAGEGAGAVSEEFLEQQSQLHRHHPEGPRGHEVWRIPACFCCPLLPRDPWSQSFLFSVALFFLLVGVECSLRVSTCYTVARVRVEALVDNALSTPFRILCPIDLWQSVSLNVRCIYVVRCTV